MRNTKKTFSSTHTLTSFSIPTKERKQRNSSSFASCGRIKNVPLGRPKSTLTASARERSRGDISEKTGKRGRMGNIRDGEGRCKQNDGEEEKGRGGGI